MRPAPALRALSRAVPDVAPRHLFEIAGVVQGVRSCARIVLPYRLLDGANSILRDLQLAAGRPTVWNDVVRHVGEDRFCERKPMSGGIDPDAAVSVIVARHGTVAAEAQRIDDFGTSEECGSMLGYPPCCIAAYAKLEAGADWIDLLRGTLPRTAVTLPFHGNTIEGLFSRSTLHPDFFPCTLGCPHAMGLVGQLLDAGIECGLDEEFASGTERMRCCVAMLDGAVVRLNGKSGNSEVHLRPGRDPRWIQLLTQPGIQIDTSERGLTVRTSHGDVATAGNTVLFA